MDLMLIAVVAVALFFDFTNGFHDAANAIATSVTTKALRPRVAVVFAGLLNFAGAFVSLKVAATVAKGIVTPGSITLTVILAGIIGAVIWNLVSWRLGMPTSSSHALIGGIAGSAIAAAGLNVIQWQGLLQKVAIPSLVSPFAGLILAAIVTLVLVKVLMRRRPDHAPGVFRRLQVITAGFVAFTHGTNDAQKTMGVIALALIAANPGHKFSVPLWVIIASASVMALGTYVGGWRIIRTLGQRVTHLEPHQGFAAEAATASLLWVTGTVGFPVSTTHTITGSVLGSGVASNPRAVHWGVAGRILIAWLVTMPAAALVGAGIEVLTRLPQGVYVAVGVLVVIAAAAFLTRSGLRGLESTEGPLPQAA